MGQYAGTEEERANPFEGMTADDVRTLYDQSQNADWLGVNDDKTGVRYWDSALQEYVLSPYDKDRWKDFKAGESLGWYVNSQGDFVYGTRPQYQYDYYDGDGFTTREGINPYIGVPAPPTAGMGEDGYQTLPEGYTREDDGSVTNPEGVNNLTPNQDIIDWNLNPIGPPPVGPDSGYSGSPGDYGGSGPPEGGYWPDIVARRGMTNENLGQGGGAIGGGGGGGGNAPGANIPSTPLQGYESSSNRDFYQRQFANMNDQQNQEAAMAAAIRNQAPAEQGPAFGGDPWSWANLPEVVSGAGSDDPNYDPNAWILNPAYGFTAGDTTHADIVRQLGGLRTFNDEDRNWFGDLLSENPDMEDYTLWARDRDKAYNQVASGGLSPDAKDRVNRLLNNVWIQQGDAPTPGGMNVPAGYASPTNM